MEFVHDFINTYGELMNEQVGHIAQSIITRITSDILNGKNVEALFTQKCMNILVLITQNKRMMARYAADFEQLYIPIFEFMVNPAKINFEDSILIILKNFIR
jgi:hypothetical protein